MTEVESATLEGLSDVYPGVDLTPGHYLAHQVPRDRKGRPVHSNCATPAACTHEGCDSPVSTTAMRYAWPKVLMLHASSVQYPRPATSFYQTNITWPDTFDIVDEFEAAPICYMRVGTILHGGNHWVAEVRVEDQFYSYDDMSPRRSKDGSAVLLEKITQTTWTSKRPVIYVYVRTSEKATVRKCYISYRHAQLMVL